MTGQQQGARGQTKIPYWVRVCWTAAALAVVFAILSGLWPLWIGAGVLFAAALVGTFPPRS